MTQKVQSIQLLTRISFDKKWFFICLIFYFCGNVIKSLTTISRLGLKEQIKFHFFLNTRNYKNRDEIISILLQNILLTEQKVLRKSLLIKICEFIISIMDFVNWTNAVQLLSLILLRAIGDSHLKIKTLNCLLTTVRLANSSSSGVSIWKPFSFKISFICKK